MIRLNLSDFDLKKICESGQIFRMYERSSGIFDIYSGDRYLRVAQKRIEPCEEETDRKAEAGSTEFVTDFYCGEQEFYDYWFTYFDLGRDYSEIVSKARRSEDDFLKQACCYGGDIRILHQDIWEMMVSFIISQQKQIPSIRKCIEALCERFGEKRIIPSEYGEDSGEGFYYAFPTPEKIAEGGPDGLKGLSLGYRERYIYETSLKYIRCGLTKEEVEAMSYPEAKKYLLSFTGIGEKVANCILLFGAGFVDAFPIDTHIKDILYREYYLREIPEGAGALKQEHVSQSQYEALIEKHFGDFAGNRGIVQQWIFSYELFVGRR